MYCVYYIDYMDNMGASFSIGYAATNRTHYYHLYQIVLWNC